MRAPADPGYNLGVLARLTANQGDPPIPALRRILALLSLLAAMGCVTVPCEELNAVRNARRDAFAVPPPPPSVDGAPASGPWQLGFRLREDLVNRTLAQVVAGGRLPRRFEREFAAELPLPDFVDDRIPGVRITAELDRLALQFRSDCPSCVGLQVGAKVTLGLPEPLLTVETGGEGRVRVYGRAGAEGATIYAGLSSLSDLRLDLASQVGRARIAAAFGPRVTALGAKKTIGSLGRVLPGGGWIERAGNALVDQVTEAVLASVEGLLRRVVGDVGLITLPPIDLGGEPVRVVRVDAIGEDQALFVGMDTDLPGAGEGDAARESLPRDVPDDRGSRVRAADLAGRRGDLSIAVAPGFLRGAVATLYRRGRLPLRFDGRGNRDPEGAYEVDVLSVSGDGDGVDLAVRIWDLAGACGTVDLACTARATVGGEGELRLAIDGLRAIGAEGSGRLLAFGVGLWTSAVRGPVDWMGQFTTDQRLELQGLDVAARLAGFEARSGRLLADWDVAVTPRETPPPDPGAPARTPAPPPPPPR